MPSEQFVIVQACETITNAKSLCEMATYKHLISLWSFSEGTDFFTIDFTATTDSLMKSGLEL